MSNQNSTRSVHPEQGYRTRLSEFGKKLETPPYDWESPRDLPDMIRKRRVSNLSNDFYGLKVEVNDFGRPTIWSETDQIDPEGIFEWLIKKEVVTSLDGRGSFDSIFKVLDSMQIRELAILGKTSYKGVELFIPYNCPWLTVRKGNKWGRLANLNKLFQDNKEFGNFTEPSEFRKGAELAHVLLWNNGLGDSPIRSPGQLIESLVVRKVRRAALVLPPVGHVQRFATAFKPARIEGTIFGVNEVIDYDISSAFPNEISELVGLDDIYWINTPKMQDEAIYAAIKCDMEINSHLVRGPIAVRFGTDSSYFPIGNITNVWLGKPEIDLLREHPDLGKITKIHEGSWGVLNNPSTEPDKPFRSLLRWNLYPLRKSSTYLSGFLKLAMAALWGKMIASYEVKETFDSDPYTQSSPLYNPIFASHVTSSMRSKLYRASMGKEIVGEFVDGIALIDSTRTRNGFGGLIEEGSGSMVLFDDQSKGCDWKNPDLLDFARGSKDKYAFDVPRNYRLSLPFAYNSYGNRASIEMSKFKQTMQTIKLGPARRLMDQYRVGDYLEYSLPSSPPKMINILDIPFMRMTKG